MSNAAEQGALTDEQISNIIVEQVADKIAAGVRIAPQDWFAFARAIEREVRAALQPAAPVEADRWSILDKDGRTAALVSEGSASAEQAWQDEHNARWAPHRIVKPGASAAPAEGATPAYTPSREAIERACAILDRIKGAHASWGGWSGTPGNCDEAINLLRYGKDAEGATPSGPASGGIEAALSGDALLRAIDTLPANTDAGTRADLRRLAHEAFRSLAAAHAPRATPAPSEQAPGSPTC